MKSDIVLRIEKALKNIPRQRLTGLELLQHAEY